MISVYAGGLSLTRPGASSDAIQGLAIKLKPGSSIRDLAESAGLNGFGGVNSGGHALTAMTPHQYADAMRGIQHIVLAVLTSSMLSFAILAVLVSAFVISNTLNVLMAQRTREPRLLTRTPRSSGVGPSSSTKITRSLFCGCGWRRWAAPVLLR